MVLSEHTKNFSEDEVIQLQEHIQNMSPEELKEFRNSFDPDWMGFYEQEAL